MKKRVRRLLISHEALTCLHMKTRYNSLGFLSCNFSYLKYWSKVLQYKAYTITNIHNEIERENEKEKLIVEKEVRKMYYESIVGFVRFSCFE